MLSTPLDALSEKDFTSQLVDLATSLRYKRYHTYRSERSPSGYPDEVLVRDRVIHAELKREKGKPTDAQIEWLTALARAGAEAYLWRPSDLDEIGKILTKRWERHRDGLYTATDSLWTPGSMWLRDGHRADSQTPLEAPPTPEERTTA
jgi:hypothetical protein